MWSRQKQLFTAAGREVKRETVAGRGRLAVNDALSELLQTTVHSEFFSTDLLNPWRAINYLSVVVTSLWTLESRNISTLWTVSSSCHHTYNTCNISPHTFNACKGHQSIRPFTDSTTYESFSILNRFDLSLRRFDHRVPRWIWGERHIRCWCEQNDLHFPSMLISRDTYIGHRSVVTVIKVLDAGRSNMSHGHLYKQETKIPCTHTHKSERETKIQPRTIKEITSKFTYFVAALSHIWWCNRIDYRQWSCWNWPPLLPLPCK